MENSLQPKLTESNGKRLPEALVVLIINFVICSVVAILVWAGFPQLGKHGLFNSWVYSQSIGQIICAGYLLMGFYIKSSSAKPLLVYGLFSPIIVFTGFFLGKNLAAWLLQEPAQPEHAGTIYWTTLIVTVVVSIISFFLYATRNRVATLKVAAAEESARASDAKLSMLQAQVEPHMLFNTLSNLRVLIDSDPVKAKLMLDHLVDFLRATLSGSMNETVTLKEEFSLLENYLSLMKIRMGERLRFELALPTELDSISIPALALQPIVENAIKHGLEPSIDGGYVNVSAEVMNGLVVIKVIDTGIGFNSDSQSDTDGFGLQSVRERLQNERHDSPTLSVLSPVPNEAQGTLVTVQFPLSEQRAP